MRPHAALLRQSGQRPVFLLCTDIYSGYTIWSALNLNFGFKLEKKTGRINKISQRRIVWIGMKVVSSQLIFRTLKPAVGKFSDWQVASAPKFGIEVMWANGLSFSKANRRMAGSIVL